MHNHIERGTFRIYFSFRFRQANFQWGEKKVFGQVTLAVEPMVHRRQADKKVLIPDCDLTGSE